MFSEQELNCNRRDKKKEKRNKNSLSLKMPQRLLTVFGSTNA